MNMRLILKKFLTQDSLLRHNFKHPGILLSTEQLQQIELKLKIKKIQHILLI